MASYLDLAFTFPRGKRREMLLAMIESAQEELARIPYARHNLADIAARERNLSEMWRQLARGDEVANRHHLGLDHPGADVVTIPSKRK
jgi:hypothetical protein